MGNGLTPLCELGYKYHTDKCPQIKHAYTPYYFKLFNSRRKEIKKVLEVGIGYYDTMRHISKYKVGASLKMWKEFFPNAQIYGADIAPEAMMEAKRIKTFLMDERKEEDIKNLIKEIGSDIDIVIDDAWHEQKEQAFLAKTMLPLLDSGVTYIIEDVGRLYHLKEELKDYNCEWPHLPERRHKKGRLFVIRK